MENENEPLAFTTTDKDGKKMVVSVEKDDEGVLTLTVSKSFDKDGKEMVVSSQTIALTSRGTNTLAKGIKYENAKGIESMNDACIKVEALAKDDAFVKKVRDAFAVVAQDHKLEAHEAETIQALVDQGMAKLNVSCADKKPGGRQ